MVKVGCFYSKRLCTFYAQSELCLKFEAGRNTVPTYRLLSQLKKLSWIEHGRESRVGENMGFRKGWFSTAAVGLQSGL